MSEDKFALSQDSKGSIIVTDPDKIAHNLVTMVTKADIMTPEDKKFFLDNTERWATVQQNCYSWRTDLEQDSILSEYPTTHLKFHQSILENKVFIDETVRLAKEAEIQKLDAEELYIDIENLKCEIEELKNIPNSNRDIEYTVKKKDIELRKKTVELQEKAYQIQQSAIAMKYRMKENKLWKTKQDALLEIMRKEGLSEEQIWDKNWGQKQGYFLLFLTKYSAVKNSKDSGEIHNLTYLARYAVDLAIQSGDFTDFVKICDRVQLESLNLLGYIQLQEQSDGNLRVMIPEQFKKP